MRFIKYTFWTLFWVLLLGFLHYTLPQRDVVYVTGVEIKREDFGENSIFWASSDAGSDQTRTDRDVRFIDTVRKQTFLFGLIRRDAERVMVYRNEDTGLGWPPYFKLDSSNLQAEARALTSNRTDPQWVVLTHYGWRNEWLTIYPNAVGIRPIDDPNVRLIPYFNILLLTILAGIGLGLFRLSQWFKRTRIDPIVDGAADTWDAVDDYADERRGRVRAWLDTWKGKPRP